MPDLRHQVVAAQLVDRHLQHLDGRKLPTERELAAEFGVSRSTVRRALDDLAVRGLVVRRLGAGTFAASVRAAPEAAGDRFGALAHIAQIRAFDDEVSVTEDLLSASLVSVPAELLELFAGSATSSTALVASTRAVHVGGRVLAVLDAHTELVTARATAFPGQAFGMAVPDDAAFRVHVADAGPRRAELLGVSSSTPLLISRRIALRAGRVVEVSTLAMPSDLGEFVVRAPTRRFGSRDPLLKAVRELGPELHG